MVNRLKWAVIGSVFGFSLVFLSLVKAQDVSPYDGCIAMITTSPASALALAQSGPLAGTQSGWHCQAVALYELGRFSEAGDLFAQLSESFTNIPDASGFINDLTVQAAEAYANDPLSAGKALVWAKRWSAVEPNNIESWFLQAELMSAAGSHDLALFPALQAQTIASANDRARALAVTAGIRLKMGNLAAAQDDLYSALLIDPIDPTSLYVLGHWYFAQGDKSNAQEVWKKLESTTNEPNWKTLATQELARF